jgi:hypothetical protein
MPVLPAFYLIISGAMLTFRPTWLRQMYVYAVISCFILQFAVFNFFPGTVFADVLRRPIEKKVTEDNAAGLLAPRVDKDFYIVKELLELFKSENVKRGEGKWVIFTFNTGIHCAMEVEFLKEGLFFHIDVLQHADDVDIAEYNKTDWKYYLLKADYVVDKSGDLGMRDRREDIGRALKSGLVIYENAFRKIITIEIGRGDKIYVYKKVPGWEQYLLASVDSVGR